MTRGEFERWFFGVGKWLSIAFFLAITVFPFVYMVSLSFKDISTLLQDPASFLPSLGELVELETYKRVLRGAEAGGFGFLRFIRNSSFVSVLTVVITTSLAIFAAYAAARLKFRGKQVASTGILLVYLFPAVVTAIPLFVMFARLGLRDELWALSIVYLAQTIPLALYMLRSHFQSIPSELEEAGMTDGLSRMGTIWRVTMPLSAPAIAAVALYVFMIAWNEFLFALLFLADQPDSWTLALGLQQLNSVEVPQTILMAGSVVISVPVILLFFLAERYLTEGLTAGGVKG
jgi:multiple sugar transport system permease protein